MDIYLLRKNFKFKLLYKYNTTYLIDTFKDENIHYISSLKEIINKNICGFIIPDNICLLNYYHINKILKVSNSYVKVYNNDHFTNVYYINGTFKENFKYYDYKFVDDYKLMPIYNNLTLIKIENLLKDEIIKKHIINNVYIENINNVVIDYDSIIESGVSIYNNVKIIKTKINKNNIINDNSVLIRTFIDSYNEISSSYIEDSYIGKNNKIGPYAHIRKNSKILNSCRIGNFVELKSTMLNTNVKAAHLTYLGDVYCGNNVNFGCGVVSCNYDGKNKNKTIIKDNCFIGSNCNLIAPITIEESSYIAAGSTVTKSTFKNSFTIERTEQITKKNKITP